MEGGQRSQPSPPPAPSCEMSAGGLATWRRVSWAGGRRCRSVYRLLRHGSFATSRKSWSGTNGRAGSGGWRRATPTPWNRGPMRALAAPGRPFCRSHAAVLRQRSCPSRVRSLRTRDLSATHEHARADAGAALRAQGMIPGPADAPSSASAGSIVRVSRAGASHVHAVGGAVCGYFGASAYHAAMADGDSRPDHRSRPNSATVIEGHRPPGVWPSSLLL